MKFTLLGIPNCDRVRNARRHLESHKVDFDFIDIRATPLSKDQWCQIIDQDKNHRLINTRSPSFRKTGFKAGDLDEASKLEVLIAQPTAMKRPVLMRGTQLLACGFDPKQDHHLLETVTP